MKLIAGKMNVIRTILKAGYADGSRAVQPRQVKKQPVEIKTITRKNEGLIL